MSEQLQPQTESDDGLTLELASWAAAATAEQVEPDAEKFARHALLDCIGVALAGAHEEGVKALFATAIGEELTTNGTGATIMGLSARSAAPNAALINGTAAHALDFDDVHFDMPGHPTVAIMPAVLAVAERDGRMLHDVITAYVVGVEVACAVGRYMTQSHYTQGWHATGTVGAIGAAAAVSHLLGADAETTARAIGLAVSQCGGLKSMFGTACKPMHAGRAAHNGVMSASLAARGFTARTDMLETAQGFAAAFAGARDAAAARAGLGTGVHGVRGILFKYHAACYGTHASIDAMLHVREEHAVDPTEIQKVELVVPEENTRICDIKSPTTGLEAKFSMTQTAAMALSGVATGDINNYSETWCADSNIVSLRERIEVEVDPSEFRPVATARVHMRDGVVFGSFADLGVPETDLARQERRLSEKFRLLACGQLGEMTDAFAQRILEGAADTPVSTVVQGL